MGPKKIEQKCLLQLTNVLKKRGKNGFTLCFFGHGETNEVFVIKKKKKRDHKLKTVENEKKNGIFS